MGFTRESFKPFQPERYSLLNSPETPISESLHDSATLSRGTEKVPLSPINDGFLPVVDPVLDGNVRSILMVKNVSQQKPNNPIGSTIFQGITLNAKNLTNLAGKMVVKPPEATPYRNKQFLTVNPKSPLEL
jgi:hypothetical protein